MKISPTYRHLVHLFLIIVTLTSIAFLTACGSSGSGSSSRQPSTLVFTTTPGTAATQDVAYAYQMSATDPAGGTVSFSLTTSPTGAAVSGDSVSWTPTAAQSRVPNNFSVKATSSSGGTASQSWTVTPGGTITVNWVNTKWTPSGPVSAPEQASEAVNLSALITNADGSITVEKSSATAPGVFSIPNVSAGYYWLQIGTVGYWTSTATFDAGHDIAGPAAPEDGDTQFTMFNFNLSGLDSVPETTWVDFLPPVQQIPGIALADGPNSTTIVPQQLTFGISGIDWTKITSAYLLQYKPVPLGSLNNEVLDYWVDDSLALVNDTTNTITGVLGPSPQASLNLDVPGASAWATLFVGAAPASPTPFASSVWIATEAYLSNGQLSAGTLLNPLSSGPIMMLSGTEYVPPQGGVGFTIGGPIFGSCDAMGFPSNSNSSQPAILTDQNFGSLQYGDPFPATWTRALAICQEERVAIPIPNSSATVDFALVNGAAVPLAAPQPQPALAPVVSTVQNATVNGASLFTAATLNSTIVPLSWSAPATGAPYGYRVAAFVQSTPLTGVPTYAAAGVFSTAKTSITLPPLAGGNTYVFAITAEADGSAQIETSPSRSSLPTGFATVVSAPITISSSALTPAIHGDRRVITRLSQAQSGIPGH